MKYSLPTASHKEVFVSDSYPSLLKELLHHRGIETEKDTEIFLHPDYENHIHDPFLMTDMDKAVLRILQAIAVGEKILIYSDYDADGIPGGAVLRDFFSMVSYQNVENYIPHRHNEGFGFHKKTINGFAEKNIDLIITIDCGISDSDAVKEANQNNIDVIITDHHLPLKNEKGLDVLPEAIAILDPKRSDCAYPFTELCGTGVIYKLIQALISRGDFNISKGKEKWLLDLVGIATLSDMVPLRGENRALAHFGLRVLRLSKRPGIVTLLAKLGIEQKHLTEDDVGFMITPRINAASRMDDPEAAFTLLSTTDMTIAEETVNHLQKINEERKGAVAAITKEVKQKIKKEIQDLQEEKKTLSLVVMGSTEWKPSLLGLVAGKISGEYHVPVFLWGQAGDSTLKGSARSEGGDSVFEIMNTSASAFTQFGGHSYAGGFAVSREQVHVLKKILVASYETASSTPLETSTLLDATLSFDEVTWSTYSVIEQLSPFGMSNPKPLFLFKNSYVKKIRLFGKKKDHLELTFHTSIGKPVIAIGFFMNVDSFEKKITEGSVLDLVASIDKNVFRGRISIRLRIVDVL